MKSKINPKKLYWASFNCFELRLPGKCVTDCSHQGDCTSDVQYWVPKIRALIKSDNFPRKPTAGKIRAELWEYGTWDETELANDDANFVRLVWCAACNIDDEEKPDCSKPCK